MTNLEDLDALQEAVGLRAYAQRDPLVEYRQEASRLFKDFWHNFDGWIFSNIFKLAAQTNAVAAGSGANASAGMPAAAINIPAGAQALSGGNGPHGKIGRNDPCPCGSNKKWKKCGLLNTEEHQRNMATGGRKHEVTGG